MTSFSRLVHANFFVMKCKTKQLAAAKMVDFGEMERGGVFMTATETSR